MDLSVITTQWEVLQSVLRDLPVEPRYAIPLGFLILVILVGAIRRVMMPTTSRKYNLLRYQDIMEGSLVGGGFDHRQRNLRHGIGAAYKWDENQFKYKAVNSDYFSKIDNSFSVDQTHKYVVIRRHLIIKLENEDNILYLNTKLFNRIKIISGIYILNNGDFRVKLIFDEFSIYFYVIVRGHNSTVLHPDAPDADSEYVSTLQLSEALHKKIECLNLIDNIEVNLYVKDKHFCDVIKARFAGVGDDSTLGYSDGG